jgi:hypothetical protein
MAKYDPLRKWLISNQAASVSLALAEIEKIIGSRLPKSARIYSTWWSNEIRADRPVQCKAWLAGFIASTPYRVGMELTVTFTKKK